MTHNNKNTIRKEQSMMNSATTYRNCYMGQRYMGQRYMDPRYMDPRIRYDVSMLPPMPPILGPLVMPVREKSTTNKRKWSEVVTNETDSKTETVESSDDCAEKKELLEAEARGRRMAHVATEYDDEEVMFLASMMRGKMSWADMCDSSDEE